MISEDVVRAVLAKAPSLDQAADQLIAEANEAGGRDNITVVLFRLEDVGGDGVSAEATTVGAPAPRVAGEPSHDKATQPEDAQGPAHTTTSPAGVSTTAAAPGAVAVATRAKPAPLARTQGHPTLRTEPPRRSRRHRKVLSALAALAVVLFLIGGGGYLASRQLFFIGTNQQGIVTIYRGLPYDLPAGIHLYETFYVSGVPASAVPADRRGTLFDNRLRSQNDAQNLVHDLELGEVSR
jgi:protein phosphatase